jgi:HEAT repeat protein
VLDLDWIHDLAVEDRIFLLLIGSIAFVFCLAGMFATSAVVFRLRNIRMAARWERLERKWETEVIAVMAGEKDCPSLWRRVGRDEELSFIDFLVRFARRLEGEERRILSELARPYLPLVAANVRMGNTESRAEAAQALSILGLPEYAEHVVTAVHDPSPLVAMIAARSLAREKQVEYAQTIIDNIDRFGNWTTSFLSSMLASLGPEVAPTLRRAFVDPRQSPQVCTVLTESLRELHDLPAADLAAEKLASEEDREVLAACLRLLGEVGGPRHLPMIRPLVGAADFVVRAHAITVLGTLGSAADVPILRDAFLDSSTWVALRAAKALLQLGKAAVLIELAGAANDRALLARQVLAEEVV